MDNRLCIILDVRYSINRNDVLNYFGVAGFPIL